ncbi:MAG: CCA tRNA nucleotidyltransferase [Sphingobium sp.]
MTTATLPDAPWRHRPGFEDLCKLLGVSEDMVRLVGGAVRDGLLGLDVSDIDLATRLTPQAVMERLSSAGIKVVPTGIAHGTVTAVLDHRPVEITTLRCDVSTDGRRATIAYTDDWREDAARRDFTINALYADPISGQLFDYFGGIDDLSDRRVRFIGDARQRIAEDHLRILRYFRFLARFGSLPPDHAAYDACTDMANSLMALSRERIADELLKLLDLEQPLPVLRLMVAGAIFAPVLPEIDVRGLYRLEAMLKLEQAASLPEPSPLIRLAALLPQDADVGDRVAARLKLSNKARKRIAAALKPAPAHNSAKELAFRVGRETAIDQLLLSGDPTVTTRIAELKAWQVPEFPVGGRDLIALGIEPGPAVSRLLAEIRDCWIAEAFPGRRRTLAMVEAYASDFLRDAQKS